MSKRKVTQSSADISEKWQRRLKGAIPDIVKGVQAVTESPTELAAAKEEKMLANLTKKIQDGTWAKQLRKVSLSEWKEKTSKKVQERMSGGVDASMSKRKEFDAWLVDRLNGVLPEIADMPDMSLEDSVSRVRKLMEHMAAEPYKAA